jgi:hypothetical protein
VCRRHDVFTALQGVVLKMKMDEASRQNQGLLHERGALGGRIDEQERMLAERNLPPGKQSLDELRAMSADLDAHMQRHHDDLAELNARLADADGLHLGQEDLPIGSARAIVGSMPIGRSTHSLRQAVEAAVGELEFRRMLSGELDGLGAIVSINAALIACIVVLSSVLITPWN